MDISTFTRPNSYTLPQSSIMACSTQSHILSMATTKIDTTNVWRVQSHYLTLSRLKQSYFCSFPNFTEQFHLIIQSSNHELGVVVLEYYSYQPHVKGLRSVIRLLILPSVHWKRLKRYDWLNGLSFCCKVKTLETPNDRLYRCLIQPKVQFTL